MNYEKFDVEKALSGEPVILRNGSKAFIRHKEEEFKMGLPLVGIDLGRECWETWMLSGSVYSNRMDYDYDIVGMYPKEPLTMPDSFWDIARADITAIAKDRNDSWFGYINCKPRMGTRGWIISTGEYVPLTAFPHMLFPDCDWEDSLILRPTK